MWMKNHRKPICTERIKNEPEGQRETEDSQEKDSQFANYIFHGVKVSNLSDKVLDFLPLGPAIHPYSLQYVFLIFSL